ncbi:MAG: type II toxin-antitoxin system VapC family toxin [Crocosphaera sp.]|nr:type II toxin-antitoxin system VapC family toxin [Crocosphaera sp.]
MKLLLDTHAFLWWVADEPQLSQTAKNMISNSDNTVYFSVVSAWEIIIKVGTGKLSLPENPEIYIPSRLISNQFETLPVFMSHVLQINRLANFHKDPFDRLLIAQSLVEDIPIVTIDGLITQYAVKIIW